MKRTYNAGLNSNAITLDVKVGTVGTAYTSVYISRSGGQSTKIAESNNNNANIPKKQIGSGQDLEKAYLIIRTTIDFSNIDASLWPNQVKDTFIRYSVDGGFSGLQTYNFDTDDVDVVFKGKVIVITKPIEIL